MTKTTSFLYVLLLSIFVFVSEVASVDASNAIEVRAPIVTDNLYDESIPLLYTSALVYSFGDLIAAVRESKIILEIPEDFPIDNLKDFLGKSLDLSYLNEGNGLCFHDMIALIELNAETIESSYDEDDSSNDFVLKILDNVRNFQSANDLVAKGDLFLATYRSIQADISCVYGVVKDTYNKRIIITFRGSQAPDFSTHDWRTNLDARLEKMDTPTLIKDKMKGKLKEHILVHKGFYEYLFDNERIAGEQRYDRIVDDIRPLMEKGYSVYVTGHSLGAALSQLFSFELAGERGNSDWMPKPITCISYAAPRSGTSGYQTAVEHEEKDGLLRMLRINNAEDVVPTLPTWSVGWKKRTMKHVGINLRLNKKSYSIIHTTMTGTWNAIQNSIFKPVWNALQWHSLPLHEERMSRSYKDLSAIMMDDLYKDKAVVSKSFLKAKTIQHDKEGQDEL